MLVGRSGEALEPQATPRDMVLESGRFVAPRFVDTTSRDSQLDRLVAIGVVDVRIHLERLHRCVERQDAEAAYGALVDLFVVTDERSAEVRRRALAWASMLLSPERRALLLNSLATGLDASAPMPPTRRSMLSLGVVGRTRLVGTAA